MITSIEVEQEKKKTKLMQTDIKSRNKKCLSTQLKTIIPFPTNNFSSTYILMRKETQDVQRRTEKNI